MVLHCFDRTYILIVIPVFIYKVLTVKQCGGGDTMRQRQNNEVVKQYGAHDIM
jgi:hypothetical protein